MRTLILALVTFIIAEHLCLASTSNELALEAKAAVLVDLAKGYLVKSDKILTVNVAPDDAKVLQKLTIELGLKNIRIISESDFPKLFPSKSYSEVNAGGLQVQLISCTQDDAILTGGTHMFSRSGWRDRFYLMRVNGKWKIVARVPYEVS